MIFVICIALAREFSKICLSIKKSPRAECAKLMADFEGIRQSHQNLCNLVVNADDILSMQIACGLSGSMSIACLMIYFTIYDDTVYANRGLVLATKIFWIVAPLGKVMMDCVSGAILNGAVSIHDYGLSYWNIYEAISPYNTSLEWISTILFISEVNSLSELMVNYYP